MRLRGVYYDTNGGMKDERGRMKRPGGKSSFGVEESDIHYGCLVTFPQNGLQGAQNGTPMRNGLHALIIATFLFLVGGCGGGGGSSAPTPIAWWRAENNALDSAGNA